jgi:hypothetical protein
MLKRGQVWVETVIYTLIGLALIGLVLSFVTPKVNEAKDKIVVEQTINSLNELDEKITEVLKAPGNKRFLDFTMKRGEMYIHGDSNRIVFVFSDLRKPYSEPGVDVNVGKIKIRSEEGQRGNLVNITLDYSGTFDLTYKGGNEIRKLTPSPVPYKISITNFGRNVSVEEIL